MARSKFSSGTRFCSRNRMAVAFVLAAALCSVTPAPVMAQLSNVGRISGTVTDTSGAVVPSASVTVTNEATRIGRTVTTDDSGYYVVTNLPVGTYRVAADVKGFGREIKSGYSLNADGRVTVDFVLKPGAVTETVEVTATGEAVNTVSGELARVVDTDQVQELALNGRNYMQLTTLIPGAPLINDDQLGLMTSLSVNQPINGNRGNTNLLAVDGGFNLDSGSNNSQINNVGIDFIREVDIKTSNFSAEYGRNSGAAINVITRSGSNAFHGSAFEYLRNDKLDANSFFNNRNNVARPALRYNDFGFSFGGPIRKDKLFFFGGIEWKYIRRLSSSTLRTLPTRAERTGDFSAFSNVFLKDPSKAGTCSATVQTACFSNPKQVPANLITADGKAIANVYNAMEALAAAYTDSPTGNNSVFQSPNPFDAREDMLRLDYHWNDRHSFFFRYTHDNFNLIDPGGTFISSPLPTINSNRLRPGYSLQLTHTWMMSNNLINEAKVNASWNGQRIPPVGDSWKRETYGFAFAQLFNGGGRFENSIPDVTFSGTGNVSNFSGAARSLISPVTDIALSDNISWVHGSHTLKTGALVIRDRKDQNGRTTYAGNLTFNPSGNSLSTGNAFADALIGNFRTYSESANDPLGFFRFTQFEAFATDNWKVTRRLSLEFGLRYQRTGPTYTQANNTANFDPSLYDPAKAVTVKADGTIDTTKGGNRFNGLIRAGSGVPSDQVARVPNANDPTVLAVPAGAPRAFFQPENLFGPRLSFAFAPFDDKTAIRGGIGLFFDKPEGNLIFSQLNLPPFSNSSQFENGNLSNVAGGKASAVQPFADINAIDPHLVVARQTNFSLSLQREWHGGLLTEISYVGNQGRHLLRQPDINQPSFAALEANAALPSAQRLTTNALRPFKGFSAIRMRLSDSTSNYNALQVYATKRKGDLTMTVSYTWSKALADTSGNGDNPEEFANRRFSYGPTDADRRHIFVTTYAYRVPFFRHSGGVPRAVLGGWELSGTTRWQTGDYLTPTANTAIGTRRADYVGGPINQHSGSLINAWFNTAAFAAAPETRRGNASVGMIEGPGRFISDLSIRKAWHLTEQFNLRFQGDLFNAFNQENWNDPNATVTSASFGTITSVAPPRNVQFGLRLEF